MYFAAVLCVCTISTLSVQLFAQCIHSHNVILIMFFWEIGALTFAFVILTSISNGSQDELCDFLPYLPPPAKDQNVYTRREMLLQLAVCKHSETHPSDIDTLSGCARSARCARIVREHKHTHRHTAIVSCIYYMNLNGLVENPSQGKYCFSALNGWKGGRGWLTRGYTAQQGDCWAKQQSVSQINKV